MLRELHIVDVFTDKPFAGNSLAVVLGAGGLSTRQMLSFAREMNFSETTFVTAPAPVRGAWPVRIFTPVRELPFAGHPALGTAHVLRQFSSSPQTRRIMLDFPAARVPVVLEKSGSHELYWMRHPVPAVGGALTRKQAADLLGLKAADIDGGHPSLEVTAGLGYLIVPVGTRAALARAVLNLAALKSVSDRVAARAVFAFAPGGADRRSDFSARAFFDYFGEAEDAATGSAGACLAAWLVETGYSGDDAVAVRVEQGAHLARPSLLHLRAIRTSRAIEVRVGGGVVGVVDGEISAARFG